MGKKSNTGKGFTETEFTPEKGALDITPEQEEHDRIQRKIKMHVACVDRELQRIDVESAIRIGDTVIAEANAVEKVSAALTELKEYYITLID